MVLKWFLGGNRRDWQVDGPHFGGWEVNHVAGSAADPARLYAAPSTGWRLIPVADSRVYSMRSCALAR